MFITRLESAHLPPHMSGSGITTSPPASLPSVSARFFCLLQGSLLQFSVTASALLFCPLFTIQTNDQLRSDIISSSEFQLLG